MRKGIWSAVALDRSHRSRRGRSGALVLVRRGRGRFATAAGTTTAAATTAAAAMVTVVVMMATTAAAIATTAAATTVTSNSHFLTAYQGDADDREKHRDA